jgi:hypothetical protein
MNASQPILGQLSRDPFDCNPDPVAHREWEAAMGLTDGAAPRNVDGGDFGPGQLSGGEHLPIHIGAPLVGFVTLHRMLPWIQQRGEDGEAQWGVSPVQVDGRHGMSSEGLVR